jgi:hypothetical protein
MKGSETPEGVRFLEGLSKEELVRIIEDDAKNWLAHDGLWFQAVESAHGMEAAIDADREAWRKFTVIEAKRIMKRLELEPGAGIEALVRCLNQRFYSRVNIQEITEIGDKRVILRMNNCRVQSARNRKGLPDFPCKSVGIVEYTEFAKTVDPRIEVRCLTCPPDEHPGEYWCAWEFELKEHE